MEKMLFFIENFEKSETNFNQEYDYIKINDKIDLQSIEKKFIVPPKYSNILSNEFIDKNKSIKIVNKNIHGDVKLYEVFGNETLEDYHKDILMVNNFDLKNIIYENQKFHKINNYDKIKIKNSNDNISENNLNYEKKFKIENVSNNKNVNPQKKYAIENGDNFEKNNNEDIISLNQSQLKQKNNSKSNFHRDDKNNLKENILSNNYFNSFENNLKNRNSSLILSGNNILNGKNNGTNNLKKKNLNTKNNNEENSINVNKFNLKQDFKNFPNKLWLKKRSGIIINQENKNINLSNDISKFNNQNEENNYSRDKLKEIENNMLFKNQIENLKNLNNKNLENYRQLRRIEFKNDVNSNRKKLNGYEDIIRNKVIECSAVADENIETFFKNYKEN